MGNPHTIAVVVAIAIAGAIATSACKLLGYITKHSMVGNYTLVLLFVSLL